MANDADTIEISNGVGVLTDAEDVDVGTNGLGNQVPIQREVVVIGGLGDASGLNGRAIKLQLVPSDSTSAYQMPVLDFYAGQLLEAILIESRRQTALLKYIAQGISPNQTFSFDGPELDLPINDSNKM